MSNYTKATNFTAKDTLPSGDSGKIVKGTEIDVELTAVSNAIASKADINSPTFTGTPAAPTAAAGTNTTQLATTAHVINERAATATLTNKTINGSNNTITNVNLATGVTGTLPVANGGTGTTTSTGSGSVVLSSSPALSDNPTAPTQTAGNNSTRIATTAFVATAVAASFPSGGIILWSGSIANIPSGWYLCNGSNGTPDLRDRFVVGAGSSYAVGATGGSTTTSAGGAHTHGGATGGHELTEAQMPKHFHRTWGPQTGYASVIPTTYGGNGNFPGGTPDDGAQDYATWSTGGGTASGERVTGTGNGQTHSHTISSVSDHTHTITPPYYALAYIMKA